MRSLLVVLVATAAVPAQVAFARLPQLPATQGMALALDPLRGRVVAYSGETAATYEWDGHRWEEMATASAPGRRTSPGLAFDPVSRRMLLFGGTRWPGGALGDTWAWDGSTWTQLQPANAPSRRFFVRMTADYARGRIVLYGGYDGVTVLGDTWEWDGHDWIALPTSGPGPRFAHALAYDPLRRVTVLFGGRPRDPGTPLADTWEWDGNAWQLRLPSNPPSPRSGAAFAYDVPSRALVLFGGHGPAYDQYFSDTWEYDGSAWRQRPSANAPQAREHAAATTDPATLRPLIAGGGRSAWHSSDVWRWGEHGWALAPGSPPPRRTRGAFVFDGNRMILIGGCFLKSFEPLDDMWAFDGTTWTQLDVTPRPPALTPLYPVTLHTRVNAVYQPHRGRVLAVVPGEQRSHTWEWDGTQWTDRDPAVAPFGFDYPLAYDARRQRVVCVTSIVGLSSTWEWDGSAWTWCGPAPQGTYGQALTYDPSLERVVLFGGADLDGTVYRGTFAWDGTTWERLPVIESMPPRKNAALVHDPLRNRLALLGGAHGQPFDDAYELEYSTWVQRVAGGPWPGVSETVAAWHPHSSSVLVLGSEDDPCAVWRYAPVTPAGFMTYGMGCANGGFALVAAGLPWVDSSWLLVMGILNPGAPVVLGIGKSRTSYLGVPLPFDLGAIGMTGCTLLASPDVVLPVTNSAGFGLLTLRIPPLPGERFYAQAFAVDAAANPLGVVASNGAAGMVGSR